MLKVEPIARYAPPSYPTRADALQSPGILLARPRRWRKPLVAAALTLTLALTGCRPPRDKTGANADKPRIPVFEHGGGIGSYGCVSVAPAVFLSEDEAAQIIRDEAALYGVDFSGKKTVRSSALPYTSLNGYGADGAPKGKTYPGEIELDGYDESLAMGFEYVSTGDIYAWKDPDISADGTVDVFETLATATRLADALPYTAVFYDPMSADYTQYDFAKQQADPGYSDTYINEQKAKIEEDLRRQVGDFIAWLAAQGII